MYNMRAHITDSMKRKIKLKNCVPIIIPGGMTKILQLLDTSVDCSFKAALRGMWESWMTEGEHSFTKMGCMRHIV